jgi:hypothetical protein
MGIGIAMVAVVGVVARVAAARGAARPGAGRDTARDSRLPVPAARRSECRCGCCRGDRAAMRALAGTPPPPLDDPRRPGGAA